MTDLTELTSVWVVEWGHEIPAEIDSLWTTEAEAKKRAYELGPPWSATQWKLRETWEPET